MPAVDIREGACVQLVGGSDDDERVRLDDPVAAAQRWQAIGFKNLHIVDLDAATDRGSNRDVILELVTATNMSSQVGGGVNTDTTIRGLLRDGAHRAVVGTRAIEHIDWLRQITQIFPRKLIIAADVRDRALVTRGWRWNTNRDVLDALKGLNSLPVAGIMVTAVHREGRMCGPDLELVRDVVERTPHPVYVAGGIGSLNDLRALAELGAYAAVVGMAFYTGALDAGAVVQEFASAEVA